MIPTWLFIIVFVAFLVLMFLAEKALRQRDDARKCVAIENARVDLAKEETRQAYRQVEQSEKLIKQLEKECEDLRDHCESVERLAQFRDIFPTGEIEHPAWGVEEDAQCMVMLRQSEVGKKLMTGLEILAHQCERQATICPPAEREHACGVAAGWRGCVGYLKTLSGKALPQQGQNTDTDPQGEEDPVKLFSP